MLSITYVVHDYWYNDPCTSNKGHWSNTSPLSFNTEGMKLTGGSSVKSLLDITYPTNFELEFTLVEPTGSYTGWTGAMECANVGCVSNGNSAEMYWQISDPYSYDTQYSKRFVSGDKIKVIVNGGTTTIYYNDVQKKSATSTNAKFAIVGSPNNKNYFRIKDLSIKAL